MDLTGQEHSELFKILSKYIVDTRGEIAVDFSDAGFPPIVVETAGRLAGLLRAYVEAETIFRRGVRIDYHSLFEFCRAHLPEDPHGAGYLAVLYGDAIVEKAFPEAPWISNYGSDEASSWDEFGLKVTF